MAKRYLACAKNSACGQCRVATTKRDNFSDFYMSDNYSNYCIVKKPAWWGLFGKESTFFCNDSYDEKYAGGKMANVESAVKKACSLLGKKR